MGDFRAELAEILGKFPNVKYAKDNDCEKFANMLLSDYKGLVSHDMHRSFVLINMINKTGYVPSRSVCARKGLIKSPIGEIDAIKIIQNHLSYHMMRSLDNHIRNWVSESPDAIIMTDEDGNPVDGAITFIEGTDGGLSSR